MGMKNEAMMADMASLVMMKEKIWAYLPSSVR